MFLARDDFAQVLRHTPLVSIDLIVRDRDRRVLLGVRVNRPAQGSWFVPGGRIYKYESLDAATTATNKLRTSQLALPQDVCETVYATEGYEQSVSNLAQVSLDSDGIFSDGYSLQMAKVTGSVDEGYVATLNIPV